MKMGAYATTCDEGNKGCVLSGLKVCEFPEYWETCKDCPKAIRHNARDSAHILGGVR